MFTRVQKYEIQKVVSQGPLDLPKDESTWNAAEIRKSTVNFSAINIMQCSVHPDEFF